MPERKWLEVLVIVVAGAGKRRTFKIEGYKSQDRPFAKKWDAVTSEMVWVDHQDIILQHLTYAEQAWGVDIVHGKRVDDLWKDFIVVNSNEFQNSLRFIISQGDVALDVIVKALNKIWDEAADKKRGQLLTSTPAMVIYTDAGQNYYDYKGKETDPIWRADPRALGVTWKKGAKVDSYDVKYFENLPRDVAFIFHEAPVYVTAHELGHLVADLPNVNEPTNLMGPASSLPKVITNTQKQRFAASHYVQRGAKPKQGYRTGLSSPSAL